MDLNTVGIGWKTETTWEAKVVERLGKYFRDQHPDGAAVWIAHSAGCEAMPMVDNHPTGYSVPLFQREIAMFARSLPDSDHVYANETLFVQSLGDYRYSSGGYLNKAAVTSWVTEADARELVAIGHSVLLLNTGYLDISYGDMSSVVAMVEEAGTLTREKWITLAGVAAGTTVGAFAHQQEHDLATPGIAATLFTPEHPNGVALPDANVASHIQTAEAIHAAEDAPRSTKSPEPGGRSLPASATIDSVITQNYASKGLGGISINSKLVTALNSRRMVKAKCCVGTGGVLVLAADGKESNSQAYRSTY